MTIYEVYDQNGKFVHMVTVRPDVPEGWEVKKVERDSSYLHEGGTISGSSDDAEVYVHPDSV